MTHSTLSGRTRLVVVGTDDAGRSTVVSDGPVRARADRPTDAYPHIDATRETSAGESDYFVEEIWRLDTLPAQAADDGSDISRVEKYPPRGGASVRKLSLPPTGQHLGEADLRALHEEFGIENVSSPDGAIPCSIDTHAST